MSRIAIVIGAETGIGPGREAARDERARRCPRWTPARLLEAVRTEIGAATIVVLADVGDPDAPKRPHSRQLLRPRAVIHVDGGQVPSLLESAGG